MSLKAVMERSPLVFDWDSIDISVLEGETSSWQLSALEHPDTIVLNYSAFLADGSALPEWLTFDANTLTFSGTPSFEEASVLAIKVVATDVNGLSAEQVFSLDVIDVNRLLELTGTPSLLMSGYCMSIIGIFLAMNGFLGCLKSAFK